MSRRKKLRILIIVVSIIFIGAYARHRYLDDKYTVSGRIQSKAASEISGIAGSLSNEGVYYVHNDSGDTSRFFAVKSNGHVLSTIYYNWSMIKAISAHDCEDIATGPGPVKGKNYIYIADIGDNNSSKNFVSIYRVADGTQLIKKKTTHTTAVALNLKYPDGPKDAETLMIDPVDRLFYIVTKRRDSVTVYTAPLAYKADDTVTLTKRCKLFIPGIKPFKWVTAGDISKDGQQVLLKNYERVYYWLRKNNEPIWQTMQTKPRKLSYLQEKLGEAIGFTNDGSGYYTTSEGVFSYLYYYHSPSQFGF
ncbi:hypothetical protein DJ568_01665 [Mucilaginibacter hurinus]|uniref:PE-PGRS family protein n=1 Tax=Mucilaginibacter hurinus TaxID=2201324 RepID=A0A367GT39_9SPHI|nr:hypothetical protein [Mucilaginibacter hurinus]RCH56592.1 hypothetical protein DJ568_01665 [Mucilaginibacter hurinus]